MIVASTNITSSLLLMVHQKREEIAILRTLGATRMQIISIFGLCGVVVGCLGGVLGLSLGALTMKQYQRSLRYHRKDPGLPSAPRDVLWEDTSLDCRSIEHLFCLDRNPAYCSVRRTYSCIACDKSRSCRNFEGELICLLSPVKNFQSHLI